MDQVVVFQKMFEQVRKEQNFSWFYSELKHHRIAHYIYYLATDNIRIITHDDTVLLLRGTRNLLKLVRPRTLLNKRGRIASYLRKIYISGILFNTGRRGRFPLGY